MNVAVHETNFGNAYKDRARRALAANDLDRCLANLELALPHHHEAARIFRAINHGEKADNVLRDIASTEENIRQIRIDKAAAAAAATATATATATAAPAAAATQG